MGQSFRFGVSFPQLDIEPDAGAIRTFAQAVEAMGFSHVLAYDHVIGADISKREKWNGPYTHESSFHEPLVLFSYMAALTERLKFWTGIIILPQRQTVLFGKQVSNLDILANGRLRIGVGLGWNTVEYEALRMPFDQRVPMLEDQIRFLRRLWTEPVFTEHGAFHDISEAGINPMPVQRPIPIWVGGNSMPALKRAARLGDGWLPNMAADVAATKMDEFREALKVAGRDPTKAEVENIILPPSLQKGSKPDAARDAEEQMAEAEVWRKAGATGVTFHTMNLGLKGADQHVAYLRRIADGLRLTT